MVRILIAEDMRILRDTLVALLELEDDLEVVAELASGDHIVPAALQHRPDVAVLDIDLPGTDGLAAAAELHRLLPECRTLILTGLGKPGTLRRALAAHVSGFIVKDAPSQELVDAVRRVAAGDRVIDATLALAALEASGNPLSPREAEVLKRHAGGASAAEIAAAMHLSYGTVRNYLASSVTKLGARNRVDAARIADEAGWL
ncbi:DNA-binding response regulator [Acrocarpospora pleiomorpha]|uniref:DNA-binding response regulator n=1 Tax=Acrocarpospora pleiomorpha TaxID=90975 RepID=A0A5M3XBG7_9ACTN|nr:DNA-binding response regulator [Acrocarpospora pleiomorpha]GES19037.1 DNA-binding response regulator [Acrocarpospora pleiomorpha]